MRTFIWIWLGRTASVLGSSTSGFALSIWIYRETGSVTEFAIGVMFSYAPGVLVAPLAGLVIDRYRRRMVLLVAETGSLLGTAWIGVLVLSGQLDTWHVYFVAAVGSMSSAFVFPALSSAVTVMVTERQRGRANGLLQLTLAVSNLLGPLLAALLITTGGLGAVIVVDLASFLLAIATLVGVRFPELGRSGSPEAAGRGAGAVVEGWRVLGRQPGLRDLVTLAMVSNFVVAVVTILIVPMVAAGSPSGEAETRVASVATAGGVGMVVGSVLTTIWAGPRRKLGWIAGEGLLGGGAMIAVAIRPGLPTLMVAAFLFFFALAVSNTFSQLIWQAAVRPDLQGRVFSARRQLVQLCTPAGYLVAGPAVELFEPLMATNGPLAGGIGKLLGTGTGHGVALVMLCGGLVLAVAASLCGLSPRIRRLETSLSGGDPVATFPSRTRGASGPPPSER